MKRAELKVGTEYAVLAPSQRNAITSGRWMPTARRVRVIDTDPIWAESYYGGYGSRDKRPRVKVENFAGVKVDAPDATRRASEYDRDAAKRLVKVVANYRYSVKPEDVLVTVVPLTQVAMTWAEYERLVAAKKRQRQREEAAYAAEERMRAAERKLVKEQRDRDIATVREFLNNTPHPAIGNARVAFNRLHGAA